MNHYLAADKPKWQDNTKVSDSKYTDRIKVNAWSFKVLIAFV